MAGRPPKPIELKRKLGAPGHSRPLPKASSTVALAVVRDPSEVESPADADELLERIWASAGSWIAKSDAALLVPLLAEGWTRRQMLLEVLEEAGWTYQAGNRLHPRPEVEMLTELERQITRWLSLLGLSPTDRSRLGVAEVRARTKLEELAERHERRAATGGRRPS